MNPNNAINQQNQASQKVHQTTTESNQPHHNADFVNDNITQNNQIENNQNLINQEQQVQQPEQKEEKEKEIETLPFPLPIYYYISGQPLTYTHNGTQIQFSVNGDMPDGHIIPIGSNGTPIPEGSNEQPVVLIQVSLDNSNGQYQRNQDNQSEIIQILQFSNQYQGMDYTCEQQFPDGSTQQISIQLIDNQQYQIENKGLLKSDGTYANFYLFIQLVDVAQ